ncbi:MAG TPA: AraC family transcriptional regulator [Clostridiales bacterium]|nr:AraC family transcriptional regulator [Clostridiales bacterium]
MKLNYILDISQNSFWKVNTPNIVAKRLPFFINEYGYFIANSNYFTEREGLANYLLMYTIEGSGYLKYLDEEYTLNPGQAVVIYCANYQYYRTLGETSWSFKWVHFDGTAASEYYELLNGDSLSVVNISHMLHFEEMLDKLYSHVQINDLPSDVRISNILTSILSELIIDKFSPANNEKFQKYRIEINKAVSYIGENYMKKITLNDMMESVYISKYHFSRIFKCYMGVSPYEYLIHFRVNKAKELLKGTQLTVSEIAASVGFDDVNNFIRKFKEIVGSTPYNYKKYNIR